MGNDTYDSGAVPLKAHLVVTIPNEPHARARAHAHAHARVQ